METSGSSEKNKAEIRVTNSEGETVSVRHGNAQSVHGETVEILKGGPQYVEAEIAKLEKSGALSIRTQTAELDHSGAGIITGEQITLQNDSFGVAIIANRVDSSEIHTKLLIAGEVYGNVNTTVDTRGAMLIGLGVGIALGLLLSLKSLLFERK